MQWEDSTFCEFLCGDSTNAYSCQKSRNPLYRVKSFFFFFFTFSQENTSKWNKTLYEKSNNSPHYGVILFLGKCTKKEINISKKWWISASKFFSILHLLKKKSLNITFSSSKWPLICSCLVYFWTSNHPQGVRNLNHSELGTCMPCYSHCMHV